MVASVAVALRLAVVHPAEIEALTGSANPIVLCRRRAAAPVAAAVAPGLNTLGVFLPTTPLHHLLLAACDFPVVATSGNRGAEPIVTEEREAVARLAGVVDGLLVHDRPIVRGVDDSVVRVIAGRMVAMRLARGLAPLPLPALEEAARRQQAPPLLAVGGQQKNAIALWTGTQALLAQHVGDLEYAETRAAFASVVADLLALFRCEPTAVACDLHPDYAATRWAATRGVPVESVQHHHAHAAACLIEHDLLGREVLAVTWDGTGYGPDGLIWGGEILRADSRSFTRVATLVPFPLPGGEAAMRQPWRTALGVLSVCGGEETADRARILLERRGLSSRVAALADAMMERRLNTPWTTSVGRLFDAVAALVLGIMEVSHEGEAAMRLEAVADEHEDGAYTIAPVSATEVLQGDWRPMVRQVVLDVWRGVPPSCIAARFHRGLAEWAAAVARRLPWREVVLGGGCFQNRLLTERTREALTAVGCRVYTPGIIPPGDGGLAAGQLAVALMRHGLHRAASR
ncbi:MAG: Sua5/YciO/YrdC/YwlC family protein, partial [Gemmataceae bacterium]|nr:Sua5/YciO/YrdC/YwlC family protein [Gemmataceae bacterium]